MFKSEFYLFHINFKKFKSEMKNICPNEKNNSKIETKLSNLFGN